MYSAVYSSIYMMPGSKAPDFDTYGLLRATHSHNPTQYSHIVGLSYSLLMWLIIRMKKLLYLFPENILLMQQTISRLTVFHGIQLILQCP